ncbi:DNA sulfur modification protein DndB [Bacillus licheniformis]|uniref:DNA sulfur modification protein DndB n=1 Tax=Bacillus TaxID=1386 RepID=UPI0009B764C1|nr:DNA sulfur modification protein DndB [Bacillus licheniformis]ARC67888.1 hypothetical protein B34_00445 [Bacillus licheniformis]MDE1421394.1 DNA sulfur modification protein DndB [Bacillus licheniformis]TWL68762.1 hypothetical protein CHCC15318_1504 [Bacillus licheniformis]TWM59980.1 hypothetical protein CHCC14813_4156 [Bacillus licheniformis]TWM60337.1 hypothetical protein CHCC14810_0994 [Bacillus licheniformis]
MESPVIFDMEADKKLMEELIKTKLKIQHDNKLMAAYRQAMMKDKFPPGKAQELFNKLSSPSARLTTGEKYFLAKNLHRITKEVRISPENYFPPNGIKDIELNWEGYKTDDVSFPYTFTDVTKVASDNYFFKVKASELFKLYESQLLRYNPKAQRTDRTIHLKEVDDEIPVPELVESSVEAIAQLTEKNDLIKSVLTFNALLGSSEEGIELLFDEEERKITVTKGTRLDVIDGWHRLAGISRAFRRNPNIKDFYLKVDLYNYTMKKARKHFGQQNTINPVAKSKIAEMSENDYLSVIINFIKDNSDIGELIKVNEDSIRKGEPYITTFERCLKGLKRALNTFDYTVESLAEARKLGMYLTEVFNTVFNSYIDDFTNHSFGESKSAITTSPVILGVLALGVKMKLESKSADSVEDVLSSLDFSLDNKLWRELKLVSEDTKLNNNAIKDTFEFFSRLTTEV